jgi:Flp pilus assembly protein TadB
VLTAVLLASGLALGIHPVVVALAGLASIEPRLLLLGAGVWGVVAAMRRRTRPTTPDDEATYFRALSAELRAGASLRGAIGEAQDRVPALSLGSAPRYAQAGMPMGEIADAVEVRFPENGRLAAAAFRLSDWSGARVAATFEGLAERAAESADLARERKAATAQARLSALMVGAAPVAFALLLLMTGRGSGFAAHGTIGILVLGTGLALEIVGLAVVALIMRRAEQ